MASPYHLLMARNLLVKIWLLGNGVQAFSARTHTHTHTHTHVSMIGSVWSCRHPLPICCHGAELCTQHPVIRHRFANESPEFTRQRASLRRVSLHRSPGGTRQLPDRSRDLDNGTGLTPMLTRALRRKFQVRLYCLSCVTKYH